LASLIDEIRQRRDYWKIRQNDNPHFRLQKGNTFNLLVRKVSESILFSRKSTFGFWFLKKSQMDSFSKISLKRRDASRKVPSSVQCGLEMEEKRAKFMESSASKYVIRDENRNSVAFGSTKYWGKKKESIPFLLQNRQKNLPENPKSQNSKLTVSLDCVNTRSEVGEKFILSLFVDQLFTEFHGSAYRTQSVPRPDPF
jgi:hypothetical protein